MFSALKSNAPQIRKTSFSLMLVFVLVSPSARNAYPELSGQDFGVLCRYYYLLFMANTSQREYINIVTSSPSIAREHHTISSVLKRLTDTLLIVIHNLSIQCAIHYIYIHLMSRYQDSHRQTTKTGFYIPYHPHLHIYVITYRVLYGLVSTYIAVK